MDQTSTKDSMHDPYLTLFVAYGDDDSAAEIREYPLGRKSRIAPNIEMLERGYEHLDISQYLTAAGPITQNPDPHGERPDTHPAENGCDAPTRLFPTPPPSDVLEIDIGRGFSSLSNGSTPEFKQHMLETRLQINLPSLRAAIIGWVWDSECHVQGLEPSGTPAGAQRQRT
jgi:hypothetical protein